VPSQAREPAGWSSCRAAQGSRRAKGAQAHEHSTGTRCVGPPTRGPGGRSLFGAWEGGSMPDSARAPAVGSSCRAAPGSRGARDGEGLEWRNAVAEVVRSGVSRLLVTILRGSALRPSERQGRAWRSSCRHRRDNSSSSSTTDVSRSGDESAVARILGAFRATFTPSTVREDPRGMDPGTLPTPDSTGGEQSKRSMRE